MKFVNSLNHTLHLFPPLGDEIGQVYLRLMHSLLLLLSCIFFSPLFLLLHLFFFLSTPFLSPSLSSSSSDYGFKPADGFNGPCVRDEAVPLDDPCADGQVKTVMKSRGYRKVAGDVCIKGVAGLDFEPYEFTCCRADAQPTNSTPTYSPTILSPSASLYHPSSSTSPYHPSSSSIRSSPNPSLSPSASPSRSSSSPSQSLSTSVTHPIATDPNPSARIIVKENKPVVAGLGIALAIAILIAVSLGVLAAVVMW